MHLAGAPQPTLQSLLSKLQSTSDQIKKFEVTKEKKAPEGDLLLVCSRFQSPDYLPLDKAG